MAGSTIPAWSARCSISPPKTATGGGRARGGSTITQQVAKYLLQDSSYSIGRKIREAILAFRLEIDAVASSRSSSSTSIRSSSAATLMACRRRRRAYFDKDVAELTLPEAAYLAVLPKAPSNYDPVRATQEALDRRNYVLGEMESNGYITAGRSGAPRRQPPLGTIRYGSNEKFRQQGGYFMEEVRRELIKQFGEKAENGPNSVYAGGLWVRTSMVPQMQDAAAEALREGLAKFDGGRGWRDLGAQHRPRRRLGGAARPHAGRHRLPRLAQGGGAVEERRRGASIGFTNGSNGTLAGLRRVDAEARRAAGRRSAICARA